MKNHNIKAVLFDLDGVIVFTDKYHYLAWKKIADEQGWEFDEQVNNRLRGIPRLASLEEILKHNHIELPMEKKLELMEQKNDYYVKLLEDINEADIYPGAVNFIRKLRERGTKISLCSSSKNAELVLNSLGISDLFDAIVTGHDIKNAKPDPEIFLLGAKRLSMPVFHCVVFEDAMAGIQGAKAAQMKTVGVGNREETEKIADQFIMNYDEIDIDTFLESGRKQPLPVDEDKIIEREFDANDLHHIESLFALGNGYMGLRGAYDESDEDIDICDGMYINGVYATFDLQHYNPYPGFSKQDEFTVNLTDWRIMNLYIDGEKACFSKSNIKEHIRALDMKKGCIEREFIFETASGKRAKVNSIRIVNMNEVHSGEIRYAVTPLNFSGSITIESQSVKLTKTRNDHHSIWVSEQEKDGIFSYVQEVHTSKQQVAYAVTHEVHASDYEVKIENENNNYRYIVTANVQQNEAVTVEKMVAFSAWIDKVDDIEQNARDIVANNKRIGFDTLAKMQHDFWTEHWNVGDIEIQGNSADQQAVRFSLFQLKQQLATVNQCSIGATGLTGPGYSGKVFWDTEMYLMPYYNFTKPESQKELLMYRYRILDKARERAREFNTVGAMYTWCTIGGQETSIVFEASVAEYHLNSDIAYSIWRYCDSTGDKEFLYDYGAEIVFETAKFMSHRGCFVENQGGKFCINVVCGPDEYGCGVNNNMYTNFMCQFHLYYALEVATEMKQNAPEKYAELVQKINLQEEDLDLWKRAADNMYYKYNEELGIHEQDDSFVRNDPVDMDTIPKNVDIRWKYHPLDLWRLQVSKQADVVLLNFIQGDKFTYDEKLRNYDYYEPKCNHGSSLSPAIHAIMAAELDKPETYEFFRCTAYMDISDFKHNTADGVHIACLGGVWMTVVNGFLGMRHYKSSILFNPRIPKQWKSYNLKFVYRNAVMDIHVTQEKTIFKLISGDTITFKIDEKEITLNAQEDSYETLTSCL